jgi:dTDP-4-dehydrorhamnose reductase
LVLRVNFYGWNIQNKQSLAEWILNQLSDGRTVPGFSDVHFCPMFVNDVAEMVLRMLDRCMTGIYHLVGSEKISKFEFARRLATVFGFSPDKVLPISMEQAKLRALRPRDTSLNTQKLANNLSCVLPDVNSGLTRFRVLSQQKYVRGPQPILAGAEK